MEPRKEKDTKDTEEKKDEPIVSTLQGLEEPKDEKDARYYAAALRDSRICVLAWPRQNVHLSYLPVYDITSSGPKLIQKLEHEDIKAFCISKDKTLVITLSPEMCQVWNVNADKIELVKKVKLAESLGDIQKILLCKDNTHLVGRTNLKSKGSLFCLSIQSMKCSILPDTQEDYGQFMQMCLLEQGERSRLYVGRSLATSLFKSYDVDVSTGCLANPQILAKQSVFQCDASPNGKCLVTCKHPGEMTIFDMDKDFSVANKRTFKFKATILDRGNGLIFINEQTIALLTQSRPKSVVFQVNLSLPELKLEKCYSWSPQRTHPSLCSIPGGFLEISGNSYVQTITEPGYRLLQQAKAAIFDYYLHGILPTSADVTLIVAGYVGAQDRHPGFFTMRGVESSIIKSERDFLNFLLDKLIRSDQFNASDTNVLKFFLEESSDSGKSLAECRKNALNRMTDLEKEYESPTLETAAPETRETEATYSISFELADFLKTLAELDKPVARLTYPGSGI